MVTFIPFDSLRTSHTLLSFESREALRPLRSARPLRTWETSLSLDKGVATMRARGPFITFISREPSVSQLAFQSKPSNFPFGAREARYTLKSNLSFEAINTW